MQQSRLVCVLSALFLLFVVSACRTISFDDMSPEQLARAERMIFLGSKAAAARIVEDKVATAEDLVKVADIVEAAAALDLPAALKAAGYPQPEWELFALFVQQQLEPYRLAPFVTEFVKAAADGVRAGATGIDEIEKVELDGLHKSSSALDDRKVPADDERPRRCSNFSSAGPDRPRLDFPVAGEVELVRGGLVLDAA